MASYSAFVRKNPKQLPEILLDGGGSEGADALSLGQPVLNLRTGWGWKL